MNNVIDYPSRLSDPNSRKFETFSYLPQMSAKQIRQQVEYIVNQGWDPAVEHTEPENATSSFWYMWKLPLFGEDNISKILAEVKECHLANPKNHVRLVGYNNLKQSQGSSMVIHRGKINA